MVRNLKGPADVCLVEMSRRLLCLSLVCGLLLIAPASGSAQAPDQSQTIVVERDAVVLLDGSRLNLGTAVADLPGPRLMDAFDASTSRGLVQWQTDAVSSLIGMVEGGSLVAISLTYDERIRTAEGLAIGDPAEAIDRIYGPGAAGGPVSREGVLMFFDTACTGSVNGVAIAVEGQGADALGAFWDLKNCHTA